jgi:hypothetical protein
MVEGRYDTLGERLQGNAATDCSEIMSSTQLIYFLPGAGVTGGVLGRAFDATVEETNVRSLNTK